MRTKARFVAACAVRLLLLLVVAVCKLFHKVLETLNRLDHWSTEVIRAHREPPAPAAAGHRAKVIPFRRRSA